MSDDPVPTKIITSDGTELEFQEYFVRDRQEPQVAEVAFEGAAVASPAPGLLEPISEADAVVLCPSNPIVSIAPILALDGVRDALDSPSSRRRGQPDRARKGAQGTGRSFARGDGGQGQRLRSSRALRRVLQPLRRRRVGCRRSREGACSGDRVRRPRHDHGRQAASERLARSLLAL